ncbi:hypothetical protein [Archangium primigenium]|uniref:hypothetical protein n=1 Tax=[Archangium] primigenium TaxID=2792470 RepID=UPI00195F0702|nr:hypothetical protein [Archangium primigenium]MBM7112981.1 hypothetical protein [Archangium primigenium]
MTPVAVFSLQSGHLRHDGRETGLRVSAALLEAQFRLPSGLFLLFLTDDCPYEERLQILLLDARFQLLDGLSVGWIYTPGILSGLEPLGPHALRFDFFTDRPLRVSVHPEGRFRLFRRLPFFARPLARRPFARHYLELQAFEGRASFK